MCRELLHCWASLYQWFSPIVSCWLCLYENNGLSTSTQVHDLVFTLFDEYIAFTVWEKNETNQLTDNLCWAKFYCSHSHNIFCSHWHLVIAWGRIWGWFESVATLCTFALINSYILNKWSSLEADLVVCDIPTWTWTCLCRVYWIL